MSNSELDEQAMAREFSAVALASLTEAVRRALLDHQHLGEKVPAWIGDRVVWVDPGQHLHKFPVQEPPRDD